MTEEKKPNFEKRVDMTAEEVKKMMFIPSHGKPRIKMSDFPTGKQIVAKVISEPYTREYDSEDKDKEGNVIKKVVHYIDIKWRPKGFHPIQFQLQMGKKCYARFCEKYMLEGDKFVDPIGLMGFFYKTKYNDTFPQFINLFKGSEEESVDPSQVFKPLDADAATEEKKDLVVDQPPAEAPIESPWNEIETDLINTVVKIIEQHGMPNDADILATFKKGCGDVEANEKYEAMMMEAKRRAK